MSHEKHANLSQPVFFQRPRDKAKSEQRPSSRGRATTLPLFVITSDFCGHV
jgi:hypothetical protein